MKKIELSLDDYRTIAELFLHDNRRYKNSSITDQTFYDDLLEFIIEDLYECEYNPAQIDDLILIELYYLTYDEFIKNNFSEFLEFAEENDILEEELQRKLINGDYDDLLPKIEEIAENKGYRLFYDHNMVIVY